MNGEDGRAVIDAVFGRDRLRCYGHAALVAAIAHERDAAVAIRLEARADMRLVGAAFMSVHGGRVVHAVHGDVCVTFSEHASPQIIGLVIDSMVRQVRNRRYDERTV